MACNIKNNEYDSKLIHKSLKHLKKENMCQNLSCGAFNEVINSLQQRKLGSYDFII